MSDRVSRMHDAFARRDRAEGAGDQDAAWEAQEEIDAIRTELVDELAADYIEAASRGDEPGASQASAALLALISQAIEQGEEQDVAGWAMYRLGDERAQAIGVPALLKRWEQVHGIVEDRPHQQSDG